MEKPSVLERIKYTAVGELLRGRIASGPSIMLERAWQQFGGDDGWQVSEDQLIDLFYAQTLVTLDNAPKGRKVKDEEMNPWEEEFEQLRQAINIHTPEGKRFALHLLVKYIKYWNGCLNSNPKDKDEIKRRLTACDYTIQHILDQVDSGFKGPLFHEYPLSEMQT